MKENSDGNDTNVGSMENSIEEYIKNAEHFINSIKTDKEYQEENGWHGYYNKEIVELARMLEHILSDYKRVLKENEILKKEKEQAWEEWNNLEQGSYETEQKLKQQLKKLQKENEELNEKILDNAGIYQLGFKDGEKSYIKKVKDKIRKNEEIIDISNDGDLIHELFLKNKVYEELLESEE